MRKKDNASTGLARAVEGEGRASILRPSSGEPSIGTGEVVKKRPYVRFTRWRRAHFFRVLERSGHVQMAAEAAGVSLACIYRLRRVEAGFVAKMDAARAVADERLTQPDRVSPAAGAAGPSTALHGVPSIGSIVPPARSGIAGGNPTRHSCESRGGLGGGLIIRRGIGGRVRVMAAGRHWWSGEDDAAFLAHLRVTGNVAASARRAGFTPKTAWNQRAARPSFARAWDQAVEEAKVRLEFGLIELAMAKIELPDADPEAEAIADPWLALWLLKWWQGRREGRIPAQRRREPDVEEVRAGILRRLDAIERHAERFGEEGG